MPTNYTTLFVCEHNGATLQQTPAAACFQLLVCPSRPLEIGSNVHLSLLIDPPELVPFFPVGTRAPFTAMRLNIWGGVVGIASRDRRTIEFEVENWNEEALVRHARILVPWLPGLTTGRDLRGSSETGMPDRTQEAWSHAGLRQAAEEHQVLGTRRCTVPACRVYVQPWSL
ncbi:uncharacterized protein TRAVEDRAFT_50019 [Trametes versicolor FP-101664 SS1]|uniref:uncharacterized protein n=1 Tax=Trametes versicolor (strain FP-101664) TaxID=717944 RepID=UPI00046222D5|nr:uncharacterized protein TRAVEDRAFT_50019 [Trametes versicolor FP-101664 SS1]EIW55533.1 hypothetical protein TRAVEDRAFT_50019 [Trametes versicolor FP-101664 SS1]